MRRTFCVAICGVRLWNSLSVGLKTVQIEPNLKRNIKRGFTIHTEMEEGGGLQSQGVYWLWNYLVSELPLGCSFGLTFFFFVFWNIDIEISHQSLPIFWSMSQSDIPTTGAILPAESNTLE